MFFLSCGLLRTLRSVSPAEKNNALLENRPCEWPGPAKHRSFYLVYLDLLGICSKTFGLTKIGLLEVVALFHIFPSFLAACGKS